MENQTAANILSVLLHCALQAIPTALTALSLVFVIDVCAETCKKLIPQLLKAFVSEQHITCSSKTQGPARSDHLQREALKQKLKDEWTF